MASKQGKAILDCLAKTKMNLPDGIELSLCSFTCVGQHANQAIQRIHVASFSCTDLALRLCPAVVEHRIVLHRSPALLVASCSAQHAQHSMLSTACSAQCGSRCGVGQSKLVTGCTGILCACMQQAKMYMAESRKAHMLFPALSHVHVQLLHTSGSRVLCNLWLALFSRQLHTGQYGAGIVCLPGHSHPDTVAAAHAHLTGHSQWSTSLFKQHLLA